MDGMLTALLAPMILPRFPLNAEWVQPASAWFRHEEAESGSQALQCFP